MRFVPAGATSCPCTFFSDRNERFFLSLSLNALSDMRVLGTHGKSEPTAFKDTFQDG